MTLILNGTDNSVSSPAVQGGTAGTTTGVYYPTTNQLALATNGTQAVLVDASQNVGIGVAPSAWGAGCKTIEFTGGNSNWTAGAQLGSVSNAYYDGSQWRAKTTGPASLLAVGAGGTSLYTASSVSAGSVLAFTQTLNVGLGTTIPLQGGTSTAGTGIAFPAVQSASSDANTLDDYEEGTWTPTVTAASGTITTVGSVSGTYIKIGRLVLLEFNITITTNGTGAGSIQVANMPFANESNPYIGCGRENAATGNLLQLYLPSTSNTVTVKNYNDTYASG
jgi:hypothetical protein